MQRDGSCGLFVIAFYVTRQDMRDEMRASNQHLAMFVSWVWATQQQCEQQVQQVQQMQQQQCE